jgi:ribulose-phosphate 3-epimerase
MDTEPTYHPENIRLSPSILTADFGRLAAEIEAAESAGADWIHLDIMDGRFVPNISFGPILVSAVRRATSLPLDVHLMIVEPDRYVPAFVEAGATIITVHQEACPHLHRQIYQIRDLGAKAGVALNPATPVSTVEEIASDIDLLLVMTVNPGFGGQSFIQRSYEKIRHARTLLRTAGSAAHLQVDGGISADNIASVAEAGADVFVTGSSVFNKKRTAKESVQLLRTALVDGAGRPA